MIRKYESGIEIDLGEGDVKLCPGIMPDTGEKTFSFAQAESKHPIGHQFHDDVGKTVKDINASVTILFKSDRDIFNLIRTLTEMALSTPKKEGA